MPSAPVSDRRLRDPVHRTEQAGVATVPCHATLNVEENSKDLFILFRLLCISTKYRGKSSRDHTMLIWSEQNG